MTVAITRTELDAAGLRAAASRYKDAAAARRMLALALVMEGHSRSEAARAAGMDRQTLRDWVHRYNERGLAGLYNAPERGRPPRKLTPEQEATVAEWVRRGPTPEHKSSVGAASICATRSLASSAYSCTNAPSASCWRG